MLNVAFACYRLISVAQSSMKTSVLFTESEPVECRRPPLAAQAEPNALAPVGDGRQSFELAGPGERLDVEQVGWVLLFAVDADDAAALAVGAHRDPVRVQ
jgi:hypothetical protein